jgi:hypothetical protein
LELVNGTYFSGHDLMQDSVIVDEEAAWQLFGSSDIIGKPVMIGGVPHYIRGVVRRETGRMWEGAGLNNGVAYISNDSLVKYGNTSGIRNYEVVMPNPVSGFAARLVGENLGFTEEKMMVIDNTARYGWEALLTVITETGQRSMHSYAIRFPYWENYARGFEDILAFMMVLQAFFLLVPAVILALMIYFGFKHRTWTLKSIGKNSWTFITELIKKIPIKKKPSNVE